MLSVDGKLPLAYYWPGARRAGKFSLWIFDASAGRNHVRLMETARIGETP